MSRFGVLLFYFCTVFVLLSCLYVAECRMVTGLLPDWDAYQIVKFISMIDCFAIVLIMRYLLVTFDYCFIAFDYYF